MLNSIEVNGDINQESKIDLKFTQMKTHILRLGSVVPHGVGDSSESSMIDLIYTYMLQKYDQDVYSFIRVNQIGDDLDEVIMKMGKRVTINIRYPVYEDFELKDTQEKNRIRLDVVHSALLRLAVEDKKLDVAKLGKIKDEILEKDFSFDLVYGTHINKKNPALVANVVVHPQIDRFEFFVIFEESGKEVCRMPIYQGQTTDSYFEQFSFGKWKNDSEFILSGKQKEVEIKINVDQCRAEIINLTKYENPPYFQMMKVGLSKEDNEKAYKDYLHSLPPEILAVITSNLS